jgi:hypothetical protein
MEIAAVEGYRSTGRGGRPKFRHEAAKIGDVVSSRMNITTGGTMEFFIYCIAFSLVASIAVGFFIEAGERDE